MAYGHLTDIQFESVYYGVVYLHGIWNILLLYEINGMKTWDIDTGNEYIEAKTIKKVYIMQGT